VSSVEHPGALSNHEARDLVAFLVLGTGPMMSTHQGLASDLGIQAQEVPDELVDELMERLLSIDPELAVIADPLLSGDPVLVLRALERLNAVVSEAVAQDGQVALTESGDGQGLVWNVNHLVTTNAGAALNVAVALAVTFALVLLASDTGGARYDREVFALKVAEGL
jgi:SdpC family antimicrobial peptide